MLPGDRTFDRDYLLSLDRTLNMNHQKWKESSVWSLQKEAQRIIADKRFSLYKTNGIHIAHSVFVYSFDCSLYVTYSKEDKPSIIWTESMMTFLGKVEAEAGGMVHKFKHLEDEQE
jgi:hypothetical protein